MQSAGQGLPCTTHGINTVGRVPGRLKVLASSLGLIFLIRQQVQAWTY